MIAFNHIHLSFNGKKIIDDLSLAVDQGEKVVVLAKSGTGKSSLFSLVLGFIEPDEGEVFFDGRMIDEKSVWEVRKKIAYVDQDVSLGGGKILDLLDLVAKLKTNIYLDGFREQLQELLQYFELDKEVIKKDIEDLSGGERQRLAIIIAVLLQRDVFLLDEVTSALDKQLKKKVADFFVAREDWTCLVISHDPVWLENPAVKIFNLEEGEWKP
ncbi:MAG: ABC transporter ATP-binding protein [Pseudomonadota bacterium]|nr:ABC transporter ATP-binding protein [Pseudomonadota bacterium]MEA3241257.1 ABC transporter ATP-binding protein [Pseudomonadota bacterium]